MDDNNSCQTFPPAGYWPSYNIPFYENVYNMSGYPDMKKKMGQQMSYQLASRAEIFRRDQSTVVDMDSYKHILRFNSRCFMGCKSLICGQGFDSDGDPE